MTLDQFLSLPETHDISADEAQILNLSLSKASVEDIPEPQRDVVLDYLTVALNMNSIDAEIVANLDALRTDLEESGK